MSRLSNNETPGSGAGWGEVLNGLKQLVMPDLSALAQTRDGQLVRVPVRQDQDLDFSCGLDRQKFAKRIDPDDGDQPGPTNSTPSYPLMTRYLVAALEAGITGSSLIAVSGAAMAAKAALVASWEGVLFGGASAVVAGLATYGLAQLIRQFPNC